MTTMLFRKQLPDGYPFALREFVNNVCADHSRARCRVLIAALQSGHVFACKEV